MTDSPCLPAVSETYAYEQGPIRPPSEARSLLVRLTRNCPWNRCTFCPVYKGARFSVRPVEHIKRDIDSVHRQVAKLRLLAGNSGHFSRKLLNRLAAVALFSDLTPLYAAYAWYCHGRMKSVFLQDANSLVMKPDRLIEVLTHLHARFPSIERVTSYARAHTVARMADRDLASLKQAGLNRLHIGLESGSDEVLRKVRKGATQEIQVDAGRKVKRAGMELSEYYMPGLGGEDAFEEHAVQTAEALNRINPDFIRLRTLAIPESAPLFEEYMAGQFRKCTEVTVARELLVFLQNLDGIASFIASDHALNLFSELQGRLPEDRERMTAVLRDFLSMDPESRMTYQVGKRLGLLSCLADMAETTKADQAREACRRIGATHDNVDLLTHEIMRQFI